MGQVRTMVLATAVVGTLDMLSAFVFGGLAGRSPFAVLTSVASGPFGKRASELGLLGPALGLLVHFVIMAVMVVVFVVAVRALPGLSRQPVLAGLVYGLLLYAFMYWVVLPVRWPTVFPQTGWWDVTNALFSHLVCVGLPIGFIVSSGSPAGAASGLRGAGMAPLARGGPNV